MKNRTIWYESGFPMSSTACQSETVLYSTDMLNAEQALPTRRQTRRLERQAAILDVAARYFLEHGYAGTTMSGIAAALGGSKGTLWSYFASKEVLFAAVLDQVIADFRAELSLILAADGDIADALAHFCREFLHTVTAPQAIALYRLVAGEANRFPEMGRIFHERGPRQTQALLGGYLATMMERGVLRHADPLRAGQQLLAMCMSGCHQRLIHAVAEVATEAEVEDDVAHATDAFLRAYRPTPRD